MTTAGCLDEAPGFTGDGSVWKRQSAVGLQDRFAEEYGMSMFGSSGNW
jgi:hypothetical protein